MGILFTGDWHWDSSMFGKSRNDEILNGIKQVVAIAKEKDCRNLFIMGDIMDSPRYKGPEALSGFVSMVKDIYTEHQGVHIFLLKGNHDWDGLPAMGEFRSADFTVIDKPSVISFDDTEILAVPYMRNIQLAGRTYGDILEELSNKLPATGKTRIAAIHAALETTLVGETEATVSIDALNRCEAKYGILGHIHKHTSPAKGWFYTGSLIRCTFGEEGERSGVYYLENGELEDIPLTAKEVVTLRYSSGQEAIDKLQQDIIELKTTHPDAVVKVNVPGESAMSDRIEAVATESDIVKYDYSETKSEKKPVGDLVIKTGDDQPLITSMRSQLSIDNLWIEYCKNAGLTDKEQTAMITLGSALLDSHNASDLWQLMKEGKLDSLTKETPTKEDPTEPKAKGTAESSDGDDPLDGSASKPQSGKKVLSPISINLEEIDSVFF